MQKCISRFSHGSLKRFFGSFGEELSSIFEADYKDPTISIAELAIVNSSILILELLEDKGYDLTQVSGTSKFQNVLMRA